MAFNLGPNRYCLTTTVFFATRGLYVRDLLTHSEYDRKEWKKWWYRSAPPNTESYFRKTLPKRIESETEFDHFVETMEELSRAIEYEQTARKNRPSIRFSRPSFRNMTAEVSLCQKEIPSRSSATCWSSGICGRWL